jgi:hypothetical protein
MCPPSDAVLRARLATSLEGVEGWLHLNEAWQLHEAARRHAASGSQPCVVEIGSWKGRSCIALALGLEAGGGGRVFAIDPQILDLPPGDSDRMPEFIANVERAGVRPLVEPVRATSHAARRGFSNNSVSVLYVDGSHDYADVIVDIEDWGPTLVDGAVVGFNDSGWAGVNQALRERVAQRGSPFRRAWFTVNTVFFVYAPSGPWGWRDDTRRLRLKAFLRLHRVVDAMWHRLQHRRAPGWMVGALELSAWGLTRALLPSSQPTGRPGQGTRPGPLAR